MQIKTMPVRAEFKADTGKRTIEGYASVFDVLDRGRDIVRPGAFAESIKSRKNRIPLLWQHDPIKPIGAPLELFEDSRGLYFKDRIAKTRLGDETLELVSAGVVDGVSIGYEAIKTAFDESGVTRGEAMIRELLTVDLFEKSIVTFPMNDEARAIQAIKSLWLPESVRHEFERKQELTGISALLSAALQSSDTQQGLRAAMLDATGYSESELTAVLNGSDACPTVQKLEALSAATGIELEAFVQAGNESGCEYPVDAIEVQGKAADMDEDGEDDEDEDKTSTEGEDDEDKGNKPAGASEMPQDDEDDEDEDDEDKGNNTEGLEVKAGRVLRKANLDALREASKLIESVISSAMRDTDEDEDEIKGVKTLRDSVAGLDHWLRARSTTQTEGANNDG